MSFWSRLFTRKITFIEHCQRDAAYPEIIHIFGAIRIMPEDGDSFDIYRHVIIDVNTFSVTNGLEQRGNSLNLSSPYVQRAMEHMSSLTGRKLVLSKTAVAGESADDAEEEAFPLESGCELPFGETDANDTDTDIPKKLPLTGLVYRKNNMGDRERFVVTYRKSGVDVASHQMSGMHDYFRFILHYPNLNRIIGTYRKENWVGAGGMAFFVLDATSGELLHNDFIR